MAWVMFHTSGHACNNLDVPVYSAAHQNKYYYHCCSTAVRMLWRIQLACLLRAFVWSLHQAVQTSGYVLFQSQATLSVLIKRRCSCLPQQAVTNLSGKVTQP